MTDSSVNHTEHSAKAFRILVVEDNRDTRDMLCELLSLLGHHPHGLPTAENAMAYAEGNEFDILITDISLPGMSGIDLAKNILDRRPGTRVIISTGYQVETSKHLPPGATVLLKPYDLVQLQAALLLH